MCFHPINWNLAEAIGLSVITDKTLYLQFFEFHNVCFFVCEKLVGLLLAAVFMFQHRNFVEVKLDKNINGNPCSCRAKDFIMYVV